MGFCVPTALTADFGKGFFDFGVVFQWCRPARGIRSIHEDNGRPFLQQYKLDHSAVGRSMQRILRTAQAESVSDLERFPQK